MRNKLIALDDGHGLETAGKQTPSGVKENTFNHAVKILLYAELLKQGFNVCDVSPLRTDTPLQQRTDIANINNADIYISIHYNAMGDVWRSSGGGIEVFYYPNSKQGLELSKCIHRQAIHGTRLADRGIKTANFHVLRETKMPAVLIEFGFMDVKYEADLMTSVHYQNECAIEVCKGICNYFYIPYALKEAKQGVIYEE